MNMSDVADKAVDKIASGIEAVANAIQKVAPHVWEVMVKQKLTEGIIFGLLWLGIGAALIFVAPKKIRSLYAWASAGGEYSDRWFGFVPAVISVAVLAVLAARAIPNYALQALNPQYYAAKELIEGVTR